MAYRSVHLSMYGCALAAVSTSIAVKVIILLEWFANVRIVHFTMLFAYVESEKTL